MLSTTLLLAASMVVGQAKDVNVPANILSEFESLVGDWTFTGEGQEGKVRGDLKAEWVPGKHAVRYEMTWTDPNHTAKGTGLHGWDAADETIRSVEFWSDGWGHSRCYTIKSPGHWQSVEWKGVNDEGKSVTGIAVLRREGSDKLIWRADNVSIGGEPTRDVNVTFVKK